MLECFFGGGGELEGCAQPPCLLLSQGITGIRFAEGEKCYIKAQPKAHVPEVDAVTKASLSSELVRGLFKNKSLYREGLKVSCKYT